MITIVEVSNYTYYNYSLFKVHEDSECLLKIKCYSGNLLQSQRRAYISTTINYNTPKLTWRKSPGSVSEFIITALFHAFDDSKISFVCCTISLLHMGL